jgi:predicted nuclease of restriction endonuclease-like RecB superfamily
LLTAELAQVRRRGERLLLKSLTADERLRALALAESYLGLARGHLGQQRGALLEAFRQVPVAARDRRLGAGLAKLVLDRCHFEPASAVDAPALRAELFSRATTRRRELPSGEAFDRDALVAEVAAAQGLEPAALEQGLYSDLPEAHHLRVVEPGSSATLLAAYEASGVAAVLLRATRVRARVCNAAPAAFRHLFRKLKFLRLLHRIEALPVDKSGKSGKDGLAPGYEITIDGPFSLFESVSKYGLQLALAYPAIAACGRWALEAEVRWGKERRALTFTASGQAAQADGPEPIPLPDEVGALLEELQELAAAQPDGGRWQVGLSHRIIDLPGAGIIVPDLELTDAAGTTVAIEVLGFWSREAVWRRVELAERGLPVPMVFVVGKQLRVSEQALPEELPAALYVYNRRIGARALLERAETVTGRLPRR